MLKQIAKLIIALNGNLKRSQIAAAFSWGVLLGLIPAGNIFWIVLFAVSFFFKNHHWSKLLVMALIKILYGVINPLVDAAGWEFLHIEALRSVFTQLYNMPFVPLTRFNNTLVAGGVTLGIILWLPVFFLIWLLVPFYRNTIAPKIRESKITKAFYQLPLVSLLVKAIETVSGTGILGR